MVSEAIGILNNQNTPINEFGKLLHESWLYKRGLSTKVTTTEIDIIYDKAIQSGAIGGKLLGAGGGGFMLLFVPPEHHLRVIQTLNLVHVPFTFDYSGSRIVLYEPGGL
jgi:D-glycero-alpha-D-manno-heptose-7-phosphate kinase